MSDADHPVCVAIAEDNPVYRAGLVGLLQASGVAVLHQAASGPELLGLLARAELPDVAILDIRTSGFEDDGLVTAAEIRRRYPRVGVLLLSAYAELTYAERLFEDGSAGRGYMIKDTLNSAGQLKEALRRLRSGLTYTDPTVIDQLIASGKPAVRSRLDGLSPRESTVLKMLAEGASNSAIGAELRTSTGSVEAAVRSIYTKLAIPDSPAYNRRVLAVLAFLSG